MTENHGGLDVWMIKFDSTGNIKWQKTLGGSSDDEGESIVQTTDGGYVFTGSTWSTDGNIKENKGNADIWVVKFASDGESTLTPPPITESKTGEISPDSDPSESTSITKDSPQKSTTSLKKSNGEDLVITSLTPIYKQDAREISFDLTSKNQGSIPTTTRFRITYFIAKEKTENPFMSQKDATEFSLLTDDIKTLAAGEERSARDIKSIIIPNTIPGGIYWFGVFIDSGDVIAETNEKNNVLYWENQITVE